MRHCVAFAVAALLLVLPAATASDSQSVVGSYVPVPSGPTTFTEHSKNVCVIRMPLSFLLFDGSLEGSFDVVATLNVKKLPADACSDDESDLPAIFAATANIHGQGTFTGSLDGAAGTFDGTMVAWHDGGFATGRIVVKHGTGDLVGLHGVLHLAGELGQVGAITGELHLAP
jgi:hypothetical protein